MSRSDGRVLVWAWMALSIGGCQMDPDELAADAGGAEAAPEGDAATDGAAEPVSGDGAAPVSRCPLPDGGFDPFDAGDAAPQPATDGPLSPPDAAPLPGPDAAPFMGDCEGLCADRADPCLETCAALGAAMAPEHFAGWKTCMATAAAGASADQARRCLADLECDSELLAGAHCDAIGRCGAEGRGWFEEDACRASPYEEPGLWACLAPERRDAVFACLQGNRCDDLEVCLDQAACQGDAACVGMYQTTLSIDCYGVCGRVSDCASNQWADCFVECRDAVRVLADEHLRSLEACILETSCEDSGADPRRFCADQLACDAPALMAAEQAASSRCNRATHPDAGRWGCFGAMVQERLGRCLTESPCGELDACLAEATCGANEGCDGILR